MEFKDYYKILGVEPEADATAIKAAYRRLARKYHPDISTEKDAEDRFKEMAEAYEVLKDPEKRAEYDELRKYGGRQGQSFTPPPGWQSAGPGQAHFEHFEGDFSDFFETLFGGGAQPRTEQRRGSGIRGQDVEIELPVFLEETLLEESKTIRYEVPSYNSQGRPQGNTSKTLKVKIPRGVRDGERIRLKGQGAPGMDDWPNGDLYLHVRLVPHPLYDVEGHNLILTLPLAPWEAALGSKITAPTLNGKIQLTIPPNSQSGQRLRVRGKGLPTRQGRGDLFALLKIVNPEHADDEMQALWRQIADKADFDRSPCPRPCTNWRTGIGYRATRPHYTSRRLSLSLKPALLTRNRLPIPCRI